MDTEESVLGALVTLLPNLGVSVKCPCPDCEDLAPDQPVVLLYYVVTALNDRYEWSRERIADWLETLDVDLSFT